ncbi:MAG TPA: ABC transporter permease, partial [Chitinophagaceae bacterium]|nr:ABC transporter permease [Chitinophagaceae bacterium]
MLKNYFIVAVRNFWRNKVFSFINILGLSIGICTSLAIFLIVSYDLSFDHFHKDTNRIYRVVSSLKSMGEESPGPGVTINLPGAITRELTGVNAVVPLYTWDKYPDITVDAGISKVVVFKKQKNIVFTNADYFKVFNYTWLTGSPQASLSKPYQVVLTQSAARLYFPQLLYTQVTGRQLVIDTTTVTVSGIVKDITQNTDLTFTAFLSQPSLTKILFKGEDLWDDNEPSSQVFVKLSPGTTPARLTANINALYARHYKPATGNNVSLSFALQPLGDLHFNAGYGNYFNNHLAHKPTLWALLAVAAFILLLACINFINLATAQASKRAKEIGLRKTMGGSKKQLVFQFLSETFLLTLMAALLSVILIPFLLKLFSGFIPRGVTFNIVKQPGILIFLFTLVTAVSLLSGFYPAVILSSCKPVLVLKNSSGNMGKSRFAWMRRFLIVTQFVIAQVFIIATIIVCRQINYSVNSNLGFKKDGIIYFNTYFSRNQAQRQVLLQKIRA